MSTVAADAAPWQQVDGQANLYRAQYQADFGEPYSLLVTIDDRRALVYSPGPELVNAARPLLPDEVQLLLIAPSLGHTMGLRAWSEAFPESRVVASSCARGRVLDKIGLPVVFAPRAINDELPDWLTLLELADNPFGECWLRLQTRGDGEADTVYWAVCDSLMNLDSLGSNPLIKLLLKWYGLGEGLHVHKRFRRGVRDKAAFGQWATAQFDETARQVLIPCHGEIATGEQLGTELSTLLHRNFPG